MYFDRKEKISVRARPRKEIPKSRERIPERLEDSEEVPWFPALPLTFFLIISIKIQIYEIIGGSRSEEGFRMDFLFGEAPRKNRRLFRQSARLSAQSANTPRPFALNSEILFSFAILFLIWLKQLVFSPWSLKWFAISSTSPSSLPWLSSSALLPLVRPSFRFPSPLSAFFP